MKKIKDLSIDRSKLKTRHALEIQNNFEDFPTREDFLYDLVRVLTLHDKLYEEFKVIEIWSDFLRIPIKKSYQDCILDQVEDGWVEIIEKPNTKKFLTFKLKDHPWTKD